MSGSYVRRAFFGLLSKGKWLNGEQVFGHDIASRSVSWLRNMLHRIGVDHASSFGLHSLMRGAARELVTKGGSKADLCLADSWSSDKAARLYLDLIDIDAQAAQESFK